MNIRYMLSILIVLGLATAAQAKIVTKTISYKHDCLSFPLLR